MKRLSKTAGFLEAVSVFVLLYVAVVLALALKNPDKLEPFIQKLRIFVEKIWPFIKQIIGS